MQTLLSTSSVARLLQVTGTTVKRWSADGKLPCVTTPGGHRRYRMRDVLRFAEEQAYPLRGTLPGCGPSPVSDTLELSLMRGDFAPVAALLLERALRGDRPGILEILTYLTKHQLSIATIGDEIIRPALASIGRGWRDGALEINQEHIASEAILEAVIRLSPELPRKRSNGRTAVCAGAEGDQHEIGLRLLSYALEGEGWTVQYVGANTPFETLRSYLDGARPDLLCLSTAVSTPAAADGIRVLAAHARALGTVSVVGGPAAAPRTAGELACDAAVSSAGEAMDYLKARFRAKAFSGARGREGIARGGTR